METPEALAVEAGSAHRALIVAAAPGPPAPLRPGIRSAIVGTLRSHSFHRRPPFADGDPTMPRVLSLVTFSVETCHRDEFLQRAATELKAYWEAHGSERYEV